MKQKLFSMLVLLVAVVTGAWATDYNITLPTVSNGSVVAKVSDVSVTSAAEGATVSLVATPDAGYKLKTISAACNISETLSSGTNTRTGTYFRVSGDNIAQGWRVGNSAHYTLTISSLSNQNLSQVVLTVGGPKTATQRNISHLQVDHGAVSATGTAQGSTVTITGINSPTVVVSAPGSGNAASMWTFTQAKIGAITLTDTSDDNVKTFTMPSSNVTVSAEFEEIPFVAVTGVTLSQTSASLTAGGAALELTPTVAPEGATDKTVKWSVEQTGDFVALYTDEACTQAVGTDAIAAAKVYVKPLAAGQATITVTTNDGAKTATCAVTVAEPTYNVTFVEGTNLKEWSATPNTEVKKDTKVNIEYTGTKKVLGMKVGKYNPDPKAVPLTFEVLTNGTIKVSFPRNGMKYSLNGGEKTAVPGGSESDISVKAGDIIEFYGNGSSYYNMGSDHTSFGGTAEVKVYGNIMSLLSETNFATATTLTAEQTFRELFRSYSKLTDASGLLLPAMTLTNNCYYEMFYSCSGMTAAPAELPAETLASSCYYEMFSSCSKLTTAPVLPATSLVSNCYRSMFSYCSKLSSVTCLATSGIDSNYSTYNWMLYAGSQAAGDKTFTADKTASWSEGSNNGIPSGWTRVDYVAPGN